MDVEEHRVEVTRVDLVSGVGFRISDLGFGGLGFRDSEFGIHGLGCGPQ